MKCEHALSALSSGGRLRRRQALRHAKRCPQCAQTLAFLQELSRTMAPEPLTIRQRELWLEVSELEGNASLLAQQSVRLHPRTRVLAVAMSLAAAVLATTFAVWMSWPVRERVETQPLPQADSKTLALQELDLLQARLQEARQEIVELERQADLLDVRRDADRLWDRYAREDDVRSF